VAKAQEAPTAAEEELAQRDANPSDTLEQDAKEQKQQRREELRASKKQPTVKRGNTPSAFHRSDHVQNNTAASSERMDQYTISNPHEQVAYGHFCTYQGGEQQSAGSVLNTGDFGVYLDNVAGSEDGETVKQVRFRRREDLAVFVVNYDDLTPAGSRGNAPR
jgi:hypothetical protein